MRFQLFQWRSLKTRVTLLTLAIFLLGIWSLGFYASRMLREDMQRILGEQQFSTVAYIANDLNDEFHSRVEALKIIANRITPAMISNPKTLQAMLEDQPVFYSLFNNGVAIAGLDGTVIADYPRLPGRLGANFKERDYVIGPLTEGKVVVSRPVMSKLMFAPAFVIGVPIFDAQGKVIGAMGGVTDLRLPNFLDKIIESRYGRTGGYLFIAPQHKLVVTGTDKTRIMQPTHAPGINPLFDRYMQGSEGYGVTVNSRGQEVLSAAKQIPAAGWFLVASIPTEEAFAPIRAMTWRLLLITIFLTLLAGSLTWWILKRQLAPIVTTIKTIGSLPDSAQSLPPLPITRKDEIGELIGSFNHLLEVLGQRERALQESEEKQRRMIANISDVIAVMDTGGTIKYKSPNITRWFGWDPEDLIGTNGWETVHPEDITRVQKAFLELLERDNAVATAEYRYKCKDGSYKLIELTAVNLANDPLIQGVLMNYRDITERKRIEEEKMRLEERLLRAEKMEALGTLAGGVAHDLNNVLGIVVGYAEMLRDEIDESSRLSGDVMKIMDGGQRAAAIVQDLLTLARRGVQTNKVFNLNAAIQDCQKTPEYEKVSSLNPRVRIETNLEANLLNIMGSPMHLAKTIMNLMINAMEAMPNGGVLTIETTNRSLDKPIHGYDAINEGDYVVLSVRDTGEGITESDINHIFEPFYTKKVMGRSGTGLGLAVVWGTVKDHKGYIDVQSTVGQGTAFTLYFPVTREEIAPSERAIPLSEYIGNDESILVIDDIREQAELAAKILGKLNYRVKTVASGEEALAYLATQNADLLVLDMIMDPGMDGLDTYKAILATHPNQKAIIVSGFSETDRVKEAKLLGAGDYIRKPYVQEMLGLAVRKELDRI